MQKHREQTLNRLRIFSQRLREGLYPERAPVHLEAYAAPGVLIVQYQLPLDVDGATAAADQVARIGVASIESKPTGTPRR